MTICIVAFLKVIQIKHIDNRWLNNLILSYFIRNDATSQILLKCGTVVKSCQFICEGKFKINLTLPRLLHHLSGFAYILNPHHHNVNQKAKAA